MLSLICSIHLKVENNEDLSVSVLINQLTQVFLNIIKFNDGASHFSNGAENLMMENFNLTMEQLHRKIHNGDPCGQCRSIGHLQVCQFRFLWIHIVLRHFVPLITAINSSLFSMFTQTHNKRRYVVLKRSNQRLLKWISSVQIKT